MPQSATPKPEGPDKSMVATIQALASSLRARTPYWLDKDDLLQEGMIGWMRAVRTFDSRRDTQFKTYAQPCIHGAMLDALRRWNNTRRHNTYSVREARLALYNWEATPEQDFEATEVRVAVQEACAALPAQQQAVLRLSYTEGLTQEEVGARLHLTPSRISQIHSKALATLRLKTLPR